MQKLHYHHQLLMTLPGNAVKDMHTQYEEGTRAQATACKTKRSQQSQKFG